MICPKCKKEYPAGTGNCPDCDIPLTAALIQHADTPPAGLLPQAAELAMVSMIFVFLSRTVATFAPGLFLNSVLAGTNQALMILAGLAVLFFFITVYREYLPAVAEGLRTATLLLVIVLSGDVITRVLGLLIIIGAPIPETIRNLLYGSVDWMSIMPFVSSLMLLIFFVVFRMELGGGLSQKMRLAAGLAIIGAAISTLVFSLGLMSYVSESISASVQRSFVYLRVIILPVTGYAAFAYVYFMSCFRKPLEHGSHT